MTIKFIEKKPLLLYSQTLFFNKSYIVPDSVTIGAAYECETEQIINNRSSVRVQKVGVGRGNGRESMSLRDVSVCLQMAIIPQWLIC